MNYHSKNSSTSDKRVLGIIGVGPRGLYAIENLISELSIKNSLKNVHILLFEETGYFGNGSVYRLDQVETNWINISERILILDSRPMIILDTITIPKFPSYHEWINKDFSLLNKKDPDNYPPRAKVGDYLAQRFESFIKPLLAIEMVSLFNEKVKAVSLLKNSNLKVETNLNTYNHLDEILLTIGHQPTELSKQLVVWEKYAQENENVTLFKAPYPIKNILNCTDLDIKSTIGVRGFGLAMIDVVRGIASQYGNFTIIDEQTQACEYTSTFDIKNWFVPFSLDGLPPAPKPLNEEIDELFKPLQKQISNFEGEIGNPSIQRTATNSDFLINSISNIAAEIYLNLPTSNSQEHLDQLEIKRLIKNWLKNDSFEHAIITSKKLTTSQIMEDYVGMAVGNKTASLDFCIGQVWRHCQPSIYKQLSYNECNNDVFAEIINLDERMKRYAYGPPVESIQQLLALVSAGVMTFEFINDPKIKRTDEGWNFTSNDKQKMVHFMIDSVLDSPQIKSVNSSIVKQLLLNDLIKPAHDDLGILTDKNGYLIPNDNKKSVPIALLGRLAKGTIIGVDAILECFGDRPKTWSKEAVKRHTNWIEKNINS